MTPTDRVREALLVILNSACNPHLDALSIALNGDENWNTHALADALLRAKCGADTARVDWLASEKPTQDSNYNKAWRVWSGRAGEFRAAIDAAMRAEASRD